MNCRFAKFSDKSQQFLGSIKLLLPNSSLISLWSPCGLYANLPYGYEYAPAPANYIDPNYDGINYNPDASANLNDLTIENTFDNNTGGFANMVNPPYSSVVTSIQSTRRPPTTTFNPTTVLTSDQAIPTSTNLPATGNSSISKR